MFKKFLMKQVVKSQLSKVPEEFRPMLMNLVENHPDLLMQMAQDLEAMKKEGKSDQDAFLAIGEKYKEQLQKLAQK